MAQNDDYIIEILLETSLITKSQLERARTELQPEETVVEALIRQGIVAQEDVTRALAAHAAKLRDTIRALAARDYPREFPEALDQVVLFLPAESLFSAALEADRDLIVWAAARQIMLATPASLIALLRAVSLSWRQHAQSENAREIAATAQELFTRVARFTEHLDKIRDGLLKAGAAYNDAVGSYERMVRPAGEKVARLSGGAADRDLAELAPLAAVLRPPPTP